MTNYYGSSQFTTPFRGTNSYKPMVGTILNKLDRFADYSQFLYNIAAGSGQAVAGDPVKIKNRVGSTVNTNTMQNFNAIGGEIYAKADSVLTIDGFLMSSPTDVVPAVGGEAIPQKGFLSFAALFGSGIETYLPADSSLQNANYASALTYDTSAGTVKVATTGTDVVLPIRMKSGYVDGQKLVYDNGTGKATFEDCKVVLVALDSISRTKEST